jgi:peptidoglycan/LPS O-acetylase OafA/YrhL
MGKQLFFYKLDALRFFAFFLVFWQHGFSSLLLDSSKNQTLNLIISEFTLTGGMGVYIFFTISGFLITFLMLKEENSVGKFNLGFFYVRRILRIWPLYYLLMILGLYVLPNLKHGFDFSGNELMNTTFLNNFAMKGTPPNVNIAWSVAIEEQFYLVWPLLFILFRNKQMLSLICITLFIVSTFYTMDCQDTYFDTLANIRYLMVGCWGAIFYFKHKERISTNYLLQPQGFYFVIALLILFTLVKYFYSTYSNLSLILMPVLYLYLVIYSVDKSTEDGKGSLFSRLGKYTYGMYMYHPMIMIFTEIIFDAYRIERFHGPLKFICPAVTLLATIGLSILSYEFFEKHILKLKNKFSFVKTRI